MHDAMIKSSASCAIGNHAVQVVPFRSRVGLERQPRRCHSFAVRCNVKIEKPGASGYAVEGNRPTSPKAWQIMSTTLRNKGVKFVSPQEVGFAQQRGVTVVDIRPAGEYTKSRIPGAANVEFFRLIEGWDPTRVARRALYAFFGVLNGTEFNPNFFTEFEQLVPDKRSRIILYCNIGGSLDPTGPSEFGQQSRSLTAAYELVRAGYNAGSIQILQGGMYEWKMSGRETEDDD